MFNKIVVNTIITKTTLQAEYKIKNKANLKSTTCPKCGYISDELCITFPQRIQGTNIYVLYSKCPNCGTEWRVKYKL